MAMSKDTEALAVYARAVDALPAPVRFAFVLCKVNRQPLREVADRLRISEHEVEDRLVRATLSIRDAFDAAGIQLGEPR